MNPNNRWISQNFEKLADLYGGRYVAVVNRKVVAVGANPDTVEKRALAQASRHTPAVVRVPSKDRMAEAIDPVRLFRFS